MNSCLTPAIRWREPRCLWKPGRGCRHRFRAHPRFRLQQRRRVHLGQHFGRRLGGGCRSRSLRSAAASSASSPPPAAARVAISARALRLRWARLRSFVVNCGGFRRGRWNVCFGYTDWSRRRDGIRGIVIGGLKRGLGRLALTGFRILFGALETIAHPLAHVRFVTQLHSSGNPAQGKRTKAASLELLCCGRGRPRPRDRAIPVSHGAARKARAGRPRPHKAAHTSRVRLAARARRTHQYQSFP